MTIVSDTELMLAFQQGDADAFEKLVLRHQVALFNFFLRMVGRRDMAEDLTQDVFLRIYQHVSSYVPSAKFTTYLYRIARNCWIDYLRKHKRNVIVGSIDHEGLDGRPLRDSIPGDTPSPSSRMEGEERCQLVEAAINSLPEEQRIVFVLSELQEMKYDEIAEAVDIPVGTVKSRMHVATGRLRDYLERHGVAL